MCVHRLYIYTTCGHSIFSPRPILLCQDACIPPDGTFSTTCDLVSHPFRSWRLDKLCMICEQNRKELLARLDAMQAIEYEESRWKVSYGLPKHGLDFWGRKAAERERLEKAKEESKKRGLRMPLRRQRKSKDESETVSVGGGSSSRVR